MALGASLDPNSPSCKGLVRAAPRSATESFKEERKGNQRSILEPTVFQTPRVTSTGDFAAGIRLTKIARQVDRPPVGGPIGMLIRRGSFDQW